MKTTSILVIGSLTEYVSGTSVSLRILVDLLGKMKDVDLRLINTAKRFSGVRGSIDCVLRTIWGLFILIPKVDVVTFHMNLPTKALPILILAKLFRKPLILRWFGGVDYRKFGSVVRRAVARFILLHADVNLKQTQWLMQKAESDGSRCTIWYSTSRVAIGNSLNMESKGSSSCRRFVFAGQVKPTKGILEIISAAERLPEGVSVDIYGDFFDGLSELDFLGLHRVNYCGVVPYDQMTERMREYDALLLPSYHSGEGYPGVVVEAYFAGIPVIVSNFQSIPEIVDETSGLLVEPRDPEELYRAMKALIDDDVLYCRLRNGAARKQEMFSATEWADYFVRICRSLSDGSLEGMPRRSFSVL